MKAFRLPPTRAATIILLLLSVIGPFSGDPHHRTAASVDTRELARIVETEVDHISAPELANWIIQGKTHFRLIDLRTQEEYDTHHLPYAEGVPISGLADHGLQRNETIALYSGGGLHAAQAWMSLKVQRYQGVYMLLWGLDAWSDEVLSPSLPWEASVHRRAAFEQATVVRRFFGDTPREGTEQKSLSRALPALPPPQAVPPQASKPKKREQGC